VPTLCRAPRLVLTLTNPPTPTFNPPPTCTTGTPPNALVLHVTPSSAQFVPPSLSRARLHYSTSHSCIAADGISWSG